MTAPLKIETAEATILRAHYNEIAHDTLRVIWRRKGLLVAILVTALLLASMALVFIGPRYKGEAIIQLSFDREQPTASTKLQPIAVVDAAAIVDSAARAVRSRATANAIVARLGLDKDPDFARESVLWRLLSSARAALHLDTATPSPRDVAVNELMRKVTITNEPHSYSISVAITTGDPELSARLANAVALEYLRGQMLQQLADARAAAERDLAQLSSVYGVRHPNYVLGRRRLEDLQSRLSAMRHGSPTDDAANFATGQSFVAAERNTVPSGPNIKLILGLTAGAALVVGIWLALLFDRDRRMAPDRHAIPGERFLAVMHEKDDAGHTK